MQKPLCARCQCYSKSRVCAHGLALVTTIYDSTLCVGHFVVNSQIVSKLKTPNKILSRKNTNKSSDDLSQHSTGHLLHATVRSNIGFCACLWCNSLVASCLSLSVFVSAVEYAVNQWALRIENDKNRVLFLYIWWRHWMWNGEQWACGAEYAHIMVIAWEYQHNVRRVIAKRSMCWLWGKYLHQTQYRLHFRSNSQLLNARSVITTHSYRFWPFFSCFFLFRMVICTWSDSNYILFHIYVFFQWVDSR